MDNSIINPSELNIYGINAFINKFTKSDLEIIEEDDSELINLEQLKETFKLDYQFDAEDNEIIKSELPAFTKLSLNSKSTSAEAKIITNYNRPPVGPIENFCYCSYCNNLGPFYHDEMCDSPEKKSLYLTMQGFYHYIIRNYNYEGPYSDLKKKWLNNELTQQDINNILLIPNTYKLPDNTTAQNMNLDETSTNIQYFDVVKIRGPSKLAYSTATEKFSNTLILSYEYSDKPDTDEGSSKTSIRISKNGLINLVNVPGNKTQRENLYKELVERIDPDSINLDLFTKLYERYNDDGDGDNGNGDNGNGDNDKVFEDDDDDDESETDDNSTTTELEKYTIIDEISYIHSLNSQFNMWTEKTKYLLNFEKLSNIISPFNTQGKVIPGKYTKIIDKNGLQIIELSYGDDNIKIINWEHSLGKETRIQTITREEIKCTIIPVEGIKISLLLHKYGTFQVSMSYCNFNDIRNNICSGIIRPSSLLLDEEYLLKVQRIFTNILKDNFDELVSLNLSYAPIEESSLTKNTVSGNAPPTKPGTSTAVCRKSDTRQGFPSLRPIPYSFKGQCPETRQYLDPRGVLGSDGLYYPCCSAKTSNTSELINKYLINGFPSNSREGIEYGVNSIEDTKSGILVPGSTNVGAVTKANINGKYTDIQIIGYPVKGKASSTTKAPAKPKEFIVKILETGNIVKIQRELLERDTRYFPGLKYYSKNQLINCISKNLKQTKSLAKTIKDLNNLAKIKEYIDVPEYNPEITLIDFDDFIEVKYYVTSIPENCDQFYLFISNDTTYLIDANGTIKQFTTDTEIQFDETIIFNGYLSEENKYFIFDLLYYNDKQIKNNENFSDKIEILNELATMYFDTIDNIEVLEFRNNIIKSSGELIIQNDNIDLLFIPEKNVANNYKIWSDPNSNNDLDYSITLQIIQKNKNYYKLGYGNKEILSSVFPEGINFDNITIPRKFIDENNIILNDYVEFEFDFNMQTKQLSTKILLPIKKVKKPDLNYRETIIKIGKVLVPIKESLFTNNKIETDYVWFLPNGKILKFTDDNLPLVEYDE